MNLISQTPGGSCRLHMYEFCSPLRGSRTSRNPTRVTGTWAERSQHLSASGCKGQVHMAPTPETLGFTETHWGAEPPAQLLEPPAQPTATNGHILKMERRGRWPQTDWGKCKRRHAERAVLDRPEKHPHAQYMSAVGIVHRKHSCAVFDEKNWSVSGGFCPRSTMIRCSNR